MPPLWHPVSHGELPEDVYHSYQLHGPVTLLAYVLQKLGGAEIPKMVHLHRFCGGRLLSCIWTPFIPRKEPHFLKFGLSFGA